MPKTPPFADTLFLSLCLGDRNAPVRLGETPLSAVDLGLEKGGWHVPVPGWAWRSSGPDADLKLSIGKGLIRKSAKLTRTALAKRLVRLAETPHEELPVFDLVSALEHLHHAVGVFETLPEGVQSYFHQAASETGLAGALTVPGPVQPKPTGQASDDPAAREFVTTFGARQRADPARDGLAILRDMLATADLTPAQRGTIALELTPHFCTTDRLDPLYAELLKGDLTTIEPAGDMAWRGSFCLPGRILAGDATGATHILEDLIAEPSRWAATPAIGWSLRYLARSASHLFDDDARARLLTQGLRYMDAQNASYFGVIRCMELQRATVDLIADLPFFERDFQADLMWTAMRCHGASPTFWQKLGATDTALPLELDAASQCFSDFASAFGSPQSDSQPDEALRGLARFGVADADRLRRDVFGAFGVPGLQDLTLLQVTRDNALPRDALIRGLSAPHARQVQGLDPSFLRDAMAHAYQHTPAAPLAEVAGRAGTLARRLISTARENPRSEQSAPIAELIALLPALCTLLASYRGVGLGLAILSDLADCDATNTTDAFAAALDPLLKIAAEGCGAAGLGGVWTSAAASRLAHRHPARFNHLSATIPALAAVQLLPDREAAPRAGMPRPTALDDTIVIIQSTRERLQGHIPALRQSWLDALRTQGIPYLIATGRGEDHQNDHPRIVADVVEFPYDDTSVDGPTRLVALLDWVRHSTDFAHVTVLDDETQLAVGDWISQQNYRLYDFYGKPATLWEKDGQRRSHQSSATDVRARHGFEKLPRNLTYADGRFGLTLSRRALDRLSDVMASAEGEILQQSAFAADRLLSAALQVADIWPMGHGLYAAGFEADATGGPSVPKHLNGFALPTPAKDAALIAQSNGNITQVVHGTAPEGPASALLWPRKVWAAHAPVRLGHYSNALHLVSAEDRLRRSHDVTVITVLRNEIFILPHFLAHYRSLGVTRFLIADNGSDDGSTAYLADQPDVILFSAEGQFRHANQGTDWKIALMQNYCRDGWALIADADEFLVYPKHEAQTLAAYLARYDGSDINAVRCLMLDMYPKGLLKDATFRNGTPFEEAGFADRDAFLENSLGRGPYSDAPTVTSGLRHRMMPGSRPELFVSQKIPLFRYKPWMRFSVSLHYAADINLATDDLMFAHFKYHADFRQKAEREVARGQYFNNAEEYRKYLGLVAEGQDRIYDPALSLPWRDVAATRSILDRKP